MCRRSETNKLVFYHGTTPDVWEAIQKEGVLWGVRTANGYHPSRCTYLATDIKEAAYYGDVLLKVRYDPFRHKKRNNYIDGCWQVRVYEPIPLSDIELIEQCT